MQERRRIEFHGSVQGVGFRYQARHYAAAYGLTGWVRNEYDGTVSMEVQGEPAQIDRMLRSLNSDHYISIDWMESQNIPLMEENGFSVRYER